MKGTFSYTKFRVEKFSTITMSQREILSCINKEVKGLENTIFLRALRREGSKATQSPGFK